MVHVIQESARPVNGLKLIKNGVKNELSRLRHPYITAALF